jgi:DNA-binding LacI/PurR family transcriptional regulator
LALNGKAGVSEKLRAEIINTAIILGYQGNIPDFSQISCVVSFDPSHPSARYARFIAEKFNASSLDIGIEERKGQKHCAFELSTIRSREQIPVHTIYLFGQTAGFDAVVFEALENTSASIPPPEQIIFREHLDAVESFINWRIDCPEENSRTLVFHNCLRHPVLKVLNFSGTVIEPEGHAISRKPTLHDIAREAGVSINTVSRALQGRPGISWQNRIHLLTLANKMGYDKIYHDKKLKLLVINEIQKHSYYVFNDFADYLRNEAVKQNNSIEIIEITGNTKDNIENAIKQFEPDGLVLFFLSDAMLTWVCSRLTVPAVSVISPVSAAMADSVTEDHYAGMDRIIGHWKLEGCERIGYVSHKVLGETVSETRYDAYKQAVKRHGLKSFSRWEIFIPHKNITEIEEYRILQRTLKDSIIQEKNKFPDVLVCFNDQLAYNTQSILEDLSITDIKVSGWDRNPFMKDLINIPFPTIKTDLHALSFETMSMLISRIRHPLAPTKTVIIQSAFDFFTPAG